MSSGSDLVERPWQRIGFAAADQLFGGSVEDADAPLGVDADDAGARARQHRLGEAAAAVDEVARPHDVVALGAQFLRHLVESLAELGEIAFRTAHRHLDMEIAGRDDVGGADQPPDRRHQPVGEGKADPHRRQQHGQRDDREHQREGDLHADAPRFEIRVFRDADFGLLDLRQHARIDEAGDEQIGIVVAAQLDQRADIIGVPQQPGGRSVSPTWREPVRRRRRRVLEFGRQLDVRLDDDRASRAEHHRGRHVAQ